MIASNRSAQIIPNIAEIILLVYLDISNVSWCYDFEICVVICNTFFNHFFTQITIADRQP